MYIELTPTDQDDPAYVALVARTLQGAIRCYKPKQVHVVQIDTWFDHKWNHYSGRAGYCCNIWLDPLTPPPFVPGRVKSQLAYEISEAEPFAFDRTKAPTLHRHRASDYYGHQRLREMTSSGLFCWYSSGTIRNDRASLMIYSVQGRENLGWYASFIKRGDWKIGLTKEISPEELKLLMNPGP